MNSSYIVFLFKKILNQITGAKFSGTIDCYQWLSSRLRLSANSDVGSISGALRRNDREANDCSIFRESLEGSDVR